MNRQSTYMYGSAARAMASEPVRRRRELPGSNVRPERRPKQKPRQRVDKLAVFLILLTLSAVMTVGIVYLHMQFKATYLSKSVVSLQSEVVEMEKENVAANMKLENSLNLTEVYKKATTGLGMKKAKDSQVYTYESKKSTQIRQHGTIPKE